MPNLPSISDAEWEVMRVLWTRAPLTAAQVVAALAARKDWSPRTVKTLLNRLVRKEALAFEAQGNRYLYRPRVSQDQCTRAETRSFLERVFGGAAAPMLNYCVRHAKLSREEIAELKRLLEDKGE